jgi:SPX domain protein involved in polyphosphate accumulation
MDRNIISTRLSQNKLVNFDTEEENVDLEGHKAAFPHAILQIRWEGDAPRWLAELNGSILTERINGFSMYPHTVATLLASQVSKLPSWVFPPRPSLT